MSRNESADEFADCVVRRTDYDTVMKSGIVVATIIIPAILAFIIFAFVYDTNSDEILDDGLLAAVITSLVAENCVIGYMLHVLANRTSMHQRRDDIWTESLIGYARSKGADVGELERLKGKMHRRGRGLLKAVSMVFIGINLLYLLALVFYFAYSDGVVADLIYDMVAVSYILLIIQYVLTVSNTYGFPYGHEKAQIAFTEELARRLDDVGIHIKPMKPMVGRTFWPVCIVLFVITLGLFSVVMFIFSCRHMNSHLRNQWMYEEELLGKIVETEGATGIVPVEGATDGAVMKVVKSIF